MTRLRSIILGDAQPAPAPPAISVVKFMPKKKREAVKEKKGVKRKANQS